MLTPAETTKSTVGIGNGMLTPAEIAKSTVGIGKTKAAMPGMKIFLLGILAGMFISLAGLGANTVSCTVENASIAKLLGACVFPGGLAMVVVAGGELFTGNTLMIMAALEKEIRVLHMLRNWVIAYFGNLVGAVLVAAMACYGGQYNLFGGALAATTIQVASNKVALDFGKAVLLGILCNFLVCIAVWMSFGAKTLSGKLLMVYMPVMLFVLSGFEHSIADMYYIAAGLFAKISYPDVAAEIAGAANLNIATMFTRNLIPVTIGNIIGGSGLVGCIYWSVYLRKK